MIEVKKRDGESSEGLLRRFTRRVQQSGLLIRAKKARYYEAPKTKREIRDDAIRRRGVREHRDYMRKLGRLEELDRRSGPRRRSR